MTSQLGPDRSTRFMATDDALRPRTSLDLASLASRAALELDDLYRGRDVDPIAIRGLIDVIDREFPSDQDLDGPSHRKPRFRATMVMKRAISDSQCGSAKAAKPDVMAATHGIVNSLGRIAETPEASAWDGSEELSRMRSLCLALSRRASAARAMREEE